METKNIDQLVRTQNETISETAPSLWETTSECLSRISPLTKKQELITPVQREKGHCFR